MQEYNELARTLVADAPTIPTYRPSSQSSKRTYTMSALAPKYQQYLSMADEVQTTDKPHARPSNENVNEFVRYLQTHASLQGNSQSTGARDMIKAGQRRLKLALRNNKKVTDSKGKPDDAARQWAALQQEGAFPRSRYRKPEHKPEQDENASTINSNSKSVSDLSFISNSKRDIEKMGRPWLDNPLETRDEPGSKGSSSQLSSLDLRDLASFVEAAVNFSSEFDDSNSPPYQPLTEQPSKPAGAATPVLDLNLRTDMPSVPNVCTTTQSSDDVSRNNSYDLPRAQFNSPHQQRIPSGQQNSHNQPFAELRPTVHPSTPSRPPPTSFSTSSKSSSAPPTPVLKLFPDTMPPRISSKGALRVPIGRSPTSTQILPQAPASQKTTSSAVVYELENRDSINSSTSLPRIREYAAGAREEKSHISAEPQRRPENIVEGEDSQHASIGHSRHSSSLAPDTIDAFPIPAPMKPLPTVPKLSSQTKGETTQKPSIDRPVEQIHPRQPDPEIQVKVPPYINVSAPRSPGNGQSSSRGRVSPFPRFTIEDKDPTTVQDAAKATALLQPRRSSLGKAGRRREEKVRSLIIRDLAASRLKKGPSKTQKTESPPTEHQEPRSSSSSKIETSTLKAHRQYQRKVSPSPSSPPPSHPASDPPRHTLQGRRYGLPTTSKMAATIENFESLSRPGPDQNARVYRRTSVRGSEPNHGRPSIEHIWDDRAENPLPSSDDESPTGGFYWNPPQKTAKRRRPRPAPILIDEPSPPRGRALKKRHDASSFSPPTPQGHRARAPEKSHYAHAATLDHQRNDAHSYYTAEPKPNPSLEGRIEHLERQNKILQAALLAALDVGVKQDLSSLLGASAASMSTNATPPLTGRSFSTTTNTSTSEVQSTGHERREGNEKASYHPGSWVTNPDPFGEGDYESEDDADVRDLEEMMDDFDLDWLSDRSSIMG